MVGRPCKQRTDEQKLTVKLKQTILRSEQHTDYISDRQQVSRHSLPTLCFLFFSQRTFFKNNFSQPHIGTFGFAPTRKANASQNQKSQFFHAQFCYISNPEF